MKQQSGNALFIVLIGIVLLAALTFTVTRGGDPGGINDEQAQMTATEIIHFNQNIRQAVARLRGVNGCLVEQISFEAPPYSGAGSYYNANSPSDYRCHVFHSEGGRMDHNALADLSTKMAGMTEINFSAGSDLLGIGRNNCGAACTDVYIFIQSTALDSKRICSAYNIVLKNNDLIPTPTAAHMQAEPYFNGNFSSTHTATNSLFDGLKSYCFTDSADTTQSVFVSVVIER